MVTVDVEGSSLYQCTHSPSWLALSDVWPGAQFACIKCHENNTIKLSQYYHHHQYYYCYYTATSTYDMETA